MAPKANNGAVIRYESSAAALTVVQILRCHTPTKSKALFIGVNGVITFLSILVSA